VHPIYPFYLAISRWILPVIAIGLVLCWVYNFRFSRPPQRVIARFVTRDGVSIPVTVAEGFIGRRKGCDVQLPVATISKKHAMFYQEEGSWYLVPLNGEVWVNETYVDKPTRLLDGDLVAFAEQELFFDCNESTMKDRISFTPPTGILCLALLTLFQVVMGGQLFFRYFEQENIWVPLSFGLLLVVEWLYFLVTRFLKSYSMLAELPVLYLFTLGLAVCICATPSLLLKQMICAFAGILGCVLFTLLLRKEQLCCRLQYIFAGITVAVLWFTALFGTKINGSRNWLSFGGLSLQPSEFAKVIFIMVGAGTLYVAVQKPMHRWIFLSFSALVMGALVLMVDFGAIALIFVTMIIILLMQLTNRYLVVGLVSGAVVVGGAAVLLFPHIAQRFGAWMHVWEVAGSDGYQQTRTMIAAANGGLFGVGAGSGGLYKIFAADTDMVFGMVCEELGLLVGLSAIACFVILALL
jgi:cell division protein FtsW (lipid II flippase)